MNNKYMSLGKYFLFDEEPASVEELQAFQLLKDIQELEVLIEDNKKNAYSRKIRTSYVGVLRTVSISQAAILQAGDRKHTHAVSKALAVQREVEHTVAGEASFASDPMFQSPLPLPLQAALQSGQTLDAEVHRTQRSGAIRVNSIYITAAGSSSSILVGNGSTVLGDSRIKHIRQFSSGTSAQP